VEKTLELELKLIADVGIIGKPNAGKSTLLARISAARPKIAAYPFTTLRPNLGVAEIDQRAVVVADIPGLIEGAHEGSGLGLEFLRHVERTRLLIHLLDGAALDPVADYRAINAELAQYSHALSEKPQIVAVNKIDLPDTRELFSVIEEELPDSVGELYAVSAVTGEGVQQLLRVVADRVDELDRELEAQRPEPTEFVHRPGASDEREFAVTEVAPGVFRVSGEEVERLAVMTDWSNHESIERFDRVLRARGVSAALEEAGVQLGDTVLIGDGQLEWR
jgi:GTP-binding protein